MFRFLKKKEEEVKLSDLREKEISPSRDWRLALCVFIGWILASCAVTVFVFFAVSQGDVSDVATSESKKPVNINEKQLEKAVQFIQTRTSSN